MSQVKGMIDSDIYDIAVENRHDASGKTTLARELATDRCIYIKPNNLFLESDDPARDTVQKRVASLQTQGDLGSYLTNHDHEPYWWQIMYTQSYIQDFLEYIKHIQQSKKIPILDRDVCSMVAFWILHAQKIDGSPYILDDFKDMIVAFYAKLGKVLYISLSCDHETMKSRMIKESKLQPHELVLANDLSEYTNTIHIYTQIAQFLEQQTQQGTINVDVIYIDTSC